MIAFEAPMKHPEELQELERRRLRGARLLAAGECQAVVAQIPVPCTQAGIASGAVTTPLRPPRLASYRAESAARSSSSIVVRGLGSRPPRTRRSPAAAHDVAASPLGFQQLRRNPQHLVADQMPVRIIHQFEIVDVAHDDAHGMAVAVGEGQLTAEIFVEMAAIEQPGERAVEHLITQLPLECVQTALGQLAFADVAKVPDPAEIYAARMSRRSDERESRTWQSPKWKDLPPDPERICCVNGEDHRESERWRPY